MTLYVTCIRVCFLVVCSTSDDWYYVRGFGESCKSAIGGSLEVVSDG